MFKLHLTRIDVQFRNCPANGLAAVDWRRVRGLPEEPNNTAMVFDPWVFTDELLCRANAARLDEDADFMAADKVSIVSVGTATCLLTWKNTEEPLSPEFRSALAELIENIVW